MTNRKRISTGLWLISNKCSRHPANWLDYDATKTRLLIIAALHEIKLKLGYFPRQEIIDYPV
jgi:hypothetical protein